MKQIRILIPLLFTLLAFGSFSQRGTYKFSKETPKEADGNYIDSNGVWEFPIRVGFKGSDSNKKPKKPIIKLKRKNLVVMTRRNGSVVKGTWELENGRVRLTFGPTIGDEEYRLVNYESGIYLESMNRRRHFKKKSSR